MFSYESPMVSSVVSDFAVISLWVNPNGQIIKYSQIMKWLLFKLITDHIPIHLDVREIFYYMT